VAVPRLSGGLADPPEWSRTRLPTDDRGPWRRLFTGRTVEGALEAGALFDGFPVALLVG